MRARDAQAAKVKRVMDEVASSKGVRDLKKRRGMMPSRPS